jgi:type III secretion protein SpaR/YscT/HrcT
MDYVDILVKSNLFKGTQVNTFSLMALIIARIIPVVAIAPFFGARVLPHPVKMALSVCLMAMVLPKILNTMTDPLQFNATLIVLAMKEIFIGTIIGFFLSIPFLILSSSGLLIDHQRGASSLMTNDPTIQNQSSSIGTLYNLILIVLFFNSMGPFYVIDTLLSSYDIVPPDKFISPLFFSEVSPLHIKIVQTLNNFATMMIQFAMPALLVILMTDTFLGIINRMAPQVQITFLGMGLKSWLALFIVCIGWSPFIEQMSRQIVKWIQDFYFLVHDLQFGMQLPS